MGRLFLQSKGEHMPEEVNFNSTESISVWRGLSRAIRADERLQTCSRKRMCAGMGNKINYAVAAIRKSVTAYRRGARQSSPNERENEK